ncbi:MAG: VanZ family protein [Actinomycetota bacterium]
MFRGRRPPSIRALEVALWCLAWTLLVAAVAGSLDPQPPGAFTLSDKLTHALGYLVLTLSFLLAAVWLPGRGPGVMPHGAALVTSAIVAVSFLIEIVQPIVGRTADVLDAATNLLGALCGLGIWVMLRGRTDQRAA